MILLVISSLIKIVAISPILLLLLLYNWFFLVDNVFDIFNCFTTRVSVPTPSNPLLLLSAKQAARKIRERKIRSEELVCAYIERIKEVNGAINALIVEKFDDALQLAKAVDSELDSATPEEVLEIAISRPLLGVPLTVTDSSEVEGYRNTIGLWARRNNVTKSTAPVIENLLRAGCVLLGATNVSEACWGLVADNRIFGRTSNPYDLRRSSGGSSGGEGALIGAAGSLIGIGCDVAGCIRVPAHFNGIFGLKTTLGLIDKTGHLPALPGYPNSMLTLGPMCRYAEDLELMTKVMAGSAAENIGLDRSIDDSFRLFYMEDLNAALAEPCCVETISTLHQAVRALEKRFKVTAEKVECKSQTVQMYLASAYSDWNEWPMKRILTDGKHDINLGREILKLVYKKEYCLQSLMFALLNDWNVISTEQKAKLCALRDERAVEIRQLLGSNGFIVCPTYPTTAPYHQKHLGTPFNLAWCGLFNMLRLPAVQCPVGFSRDGLPIGIQIVGPEYSDGQLIKLAEEMERQFGGWKIASKRKTSEEVISFNC